MKCPACEKDIRAHVYYCAKCAVYVYEKCWQKHVEMADKEEE